MTGSIGMKDSEGPVKIPGLIHEPFPDAVSAVTVTTTVLRYDDAS